MAGREGSDGGTRGCKGGKVTRQGKSGYYN